ncbi:hypothetical protein GCM10023335_53040 [Streptomyces siamensis]|uniref:DUF397 domain-containing protein n=1 Tax=Streptomyces siamensis TaxID=1274986 RepID=A0ABP9J7T2_9ACTN
MPGRPTAFAEPPTTGAAGQSVGGSRSARCTAAAFSHRRFREAVRTASCAKGNGVGNTPVDDPA